MSGQKNERIPRATTTNARVFLLIPSGFIIREGRGGLCSGKYGVPNRISMVARLPVFRTDDCSAMGNQQAVQVAAGQPCHSIGCWRKIAWLLKNSLSRNPQKLDRVRMPYKRFSLVAWT